MIVLLNANTKIDKNSVKYCTDSSKERIKDEAKNISHAMDTEHERQEWMRTFFERQDKELTEEAEVQYIPVREHPLKVYESSNSHLSAISYEQSLQTMIEYVG